MKATAEPFQIESQNGDASDASIPSGSNVGWMSWMGRVMNELETERSTCLSALHYFVMFIAIAIVIKEVNIPNLVASRNISDTGQDIISTFLDFVLCAILVFFIWPCFFVNHHKNVYMRGASLIFNFGFNTLTLWLITQKYYSPPYNAANAFAIFIVCAAIFAQTVLSVLQVIGKNDGASQFDFYLGIRVQYVKKLLFGGSNRNSQRHSGATHVLDDDHSAPTGSNKKKCDDKKKTSNEITCYDGTVHADVPAMMTHLSREHHCTAEELLSRPPLSWTAEYSHTNTKASLPGIEISDKNAEDPIYEGVSGHLLKCFHWFYPDMKGVDDSTFYFPNIVLFTTGTALFVVFGILAGMHSDVFVAHTAAQYSCHRCHTPHPLPSP